MFGIACYFNSLIQILFFLPNIQEKILNFKEKDINDAASDLKLEGADRIKLLMSKQLVQNLQKLYTNMMMTNVKYLNPKDVLECIVDDSGHKIRYHEQADICEFFLNFLDRLQEGLSENKKLIRQMMGEELKNEQEGDQSEMVQSIAVSPNPGAENVDLLGINQQNSEQDKTGHQSNADEILNFGSIHRQNSICDPVRKQSVADPSRSSQLYNYNLDAFKNSIWENFIGSHV